MRSRRRGRIALWLLPAMLAGCSGQSGPFSMIHHIIGGSSSGKPPPAPGLNAPFPNLASVPPKPHALPEQEQTRIETRLQTANAAARAQLASGAASHAVPAPRPSPPPVLIGFTPHSAIIPRKELGILRGMIKKPAGASAILAAGFGGTMDAAGLRLGLYRALAIANALTAAGIPPQDIRLAALASGHGGFAQWLYDTVPQPTPSNDSPRNSK
jgi:hypothetical protein